MVPVIRLPELCLLAIFRQLPPIDQMIARKVCYQWSILVPQATLKKPFLAIICGTSKKKKKKKKNRLKKEVYEESMDTWLPSDARRSELLLKNSNGSPLYPRRRLTVWNTLCYDELDVTSATDIVATFAGVTMLYVTIRSPSDQLDLLSYILCQWSYRLVSFKFFEKFDELVPEEIAASFYESINSLTCLKHLTFLAKNLPHGNLSILGGGEEEKGQLEELCFSSRRTTAEAFTTMLQEYAEKSTTLRTIEYRNDKQESLDVIEIFQMNLSQELCNCFTRIDLFLDEFPFIKDIARHFQFLTVLTLTAFIDDEDDGDLRNIRFYLTHLAKLERLVRLSLHIDLTMVNADDRPDLLLPQLKSLKALELDVSKCSHEDLNQLNIPWTMPNIEVIDFYFFEYLCTDCFIVDPCISQPFDNLEVFNEKVKQCLRLIFAPLKASCQQLHTIRHNREDMCGTAEELLAVATVAEEEKKMEDSPDNDGPMQKKAKMSTEEQGDD